MAESHTSCRKEGVIFLVAPCLQFVCIFCVWKVILCFIASEEERAEPNGFVVVVVFGDRDVGDCVAMKTFFSTQSEERLDFFLFLFLGLEYEARNMKDDYLRAFTGSTCLYLIPCWTTIEDEIVRCVCGIIVLLNGAHS